VINGLENIPICARFRGLFWELSMRVHFPVALTKHVRQFGHRGDRSERGNRDSQPSIRSDISYAPKDEASGRRELSL
jgi:hypothetical protein